MWPLLPDPSELTKAGDVGIGLQKSRRMPSHTKSMDGT
jgi:hypothetical protein